LIAKPSFALSPDTALLYLEQRGFDPRFLRVTELPGGVSNVVLLAEHASGRLVLKQALPQLRVQQEWFSDIRRIYTECAGMRAVATMLPPGSVPEVLFEDRPNYLFAMTVGEPGAESWKSQLMRGECDARIARSVASILGTMIRSSWRSEKLAEQFDDIAIFDELRLDPYYERMACLYPELRPHFEDLVANCRNRRVSLVHGDWSPKNFLVSDGRAMAIDFEVLHFGDPSFDAAFLLNHLLLKTFYGISGAPALAAAFWEALLSELPEAPWFESATIAHLGGLLLARMDGKSPAEYIRDEDLKQRIREFARGLIVSPPSRVVDVWERYDRKN
jgi:5-methylthioribose kinase